MPVTKAVIPAAGLGTRLLPATKSQPKEMLPIVDAPAIQYVIEECVSSGITEILMIIGRGKRAIEEHFHPSPELERALTEKGETELRKQIGRISNLASIHFVWQKELNGLGDAVSYGKSFVGDDPFALLLGDTLLSSEDPGRPVMRQMLDIFEETGSSVIALEEVAESKLSRYGIAGGSNRGKGVFEVSQLIEKPSIQEAPSNLAIAGRYVLRPEIFSFIAETGPGRNGEIQLTDALARLLERHGLLGLRFTGKRYDIGDKFDFLRTNIEFGLQREDIGADLANYLKRIVAEL
ncbi:MAG: UTP--glucose-1-phosphate uridylyltransferase [Verrucomicrobiaceae bacterium]|nr:UTP--glucose-1-phosphate uridylyltransferase [Verrucomicrobiaceae bacterium]